MSRSSLERAGRRGGASFLATKIDEKHRMKESVGMHRTGLTPSLLRLFEPRPFPPHLDAIKHHKAPVPYSGVGAYIEHFAKPGDSEYQPEPAEIRPEEPRLFANRELAVQCRLDQPTRTERKIAEAKAAAEKHAAALEEAIASYDPAKDPNIEGDPYKTLFVTKLSYDVSERKLRREFEEFGPVKRIRLVHDKHSGKPRGYAFVEYEHKSDMKEAYKAADGRRIEGRRCLVDVERGRTVPEWRPRRLGGGKGGETRVARMPRNQRRHVERRIVDAALGVDSAEPAPPTTAAGAVADSRGAYGGAQRERGDPDRSSRPPRDDGDRYARRSDRERSESRYYSGNRDRERDRDRSAGYDRDRDRDRSDRRKRDRYDEPLGGGYRSSRDDRASDRYAGYYGASGSGGGGAYGSAGYDAPSGAGYPVPPSAPINDEPEEGEYPIGGIGVAGGAGAGDDGFEEGERFAKRPRET